MAQQWEAPEHHVRYDILHKEYFRVNPSNIAKCYNAEHPELCYRIIKARIAPMTLEELCSHGLSVTSIPRQMYNPWTNSVD